MSLNMGLPTVAGYTSVQHARPLAQAASLERILKLAVRVPVFPCNPTNKQPLVEGGFHSASQDVATITDWWTQWTDALVGVPTGERSGLFVVDIDSYKDDPSGRDWVADNSLLLTSTRYHKTANGGLHYIFQQPKEIRTKTAAGIIVNSRKLESVDIRGDGGYIIYWPLHGLNRDGQAQPMPAEFVAIFQRQTDRAAVGRASALTDVVEFPASWHRDHRQVASALAYLDPSDRDQWIQVGMAIHLSAGGGDAGFALWHAWSAGALNAKTPDNYGGVEDCRRTWMSFRHETATPVRLGTVFARAKAAGWAAPIADETVAQNGQLNEPGAGAWPESLEPDAYCGLIGDIVKAVEPETESDPASILLQTIVTFGALVGRGPHVRVEGDQHHLNLFALLVGDTSKARKGTSWGRVREIFTRTADCPRVVDGLASGEGLKWQVRDPDDRGDADGDAGVSDKRLLVVESEFSQVLRQCARPGNTLSATVRAAWDTGRLMSLTKNDPVVATGAHVSIIGHITTQELRLELTATDSANGFANRFLFMCVKRSKMLPLGGRPLADDVVDELSARIARAVGHARSKGSVQMSVEALEVWRTVYPALSAGHPGLFGAVTARAEAQVLRLALAFALACEAEQIERMHLLAAIAVWERAEASARHIFGSAFGDRVADEILQALRTAGSAGLTRTDINNLFRRNQSSERISAALDLLSRNNLAMKVLATSQAGRPAEAWRIP